MGICTRVFDWYQNRWPWMTLKGNNSLCYIMRLPFWLPSVITKIFYFHCSSVCDWHAFNKCNLLARLPMIVWMKIDSYNQRRKCSAETLFCDDIRIMRIFVGVRWIESSNESSVVENCHFASCGRYIFRHFVYETKIIRPPVTVVREDL